MAQKEVNMLFNSLFSRIYEDDYGLFSVSHWKPIHFMPIKLANARLQKIINNTPMHVIEPHKSFFASSFFPFGYH